MAETLVTRRCVIAIGDYDPQDVTQQFAIFRKGLDRFSQTWRLTTRISPFKLQGGGAIAVWHIETKAPNWTVETEYRLLNWSDIVKRDFGRWDLRRAWRAVTAITDFVMSGTCYRYFRLNWRFGLFFSYPLLALFSISILSLWLGVILSNLEVPFPPLIALSSFAAMVTIYIKWIDPIVLPSVIDKWIFLHELVHLERTNLAERLGVFVEDLITILKSHSYDEILLTGHGIGAVLQPIILDRAFWAVPEFGKDGRSISLLSVGSMLLAVGLHPEGGWVVSPASRVARDKWVYWAEYQAREDILSFPGRNPITELLSDHGRPVLQKIDLREMTEATAHRRFPASAYKNHRQLIRANTKKYFYDYFMIVCGPFDLRTRVKRPDLMTDGFGSNGELVPEKKKPEARL